MSSQLILWPVFIAWSAKHEKPVPLRQDLYAWPCAPVEYVVLPITDTIAINIVNLVHNMRNKAFRQFKFYCIVK